MGIKLGDISPLAGAVSGKGLFGKGLAKMGDAMGPMGGLMPMLAASQRKKLLAREAAAKAAQGERAGAPTMGGRPGTMGDSGENTQQFKRGGKVKKMAKGGSTASKRGDGCATKGKTKGRFV